MKLYNKEKVIRLAEKLKLTITIRPDGRIVGLPSQLELKEFLTSKE